MYQNNKSTYSMPFCGLTLKLYKIVDNSDNHIDYFAIIKKTKKNA